MKNILILTGLVIITLLFTSGCKSSTEPNENYISIKTEKTTYSRTGWSGVIITLTNNMEQNVFLPIDSTFVLARKNGDEWITGIWTMQRIGHWNYYALYPNLSHEEMMYPGSIPSAGTYRFKFRIYTDSTLTKSIPENLLYSNTFEAVI